MKKTWIGILICSLMVFPIIMLPTTAESPTKFITAVYGSFPLPLPENESFPDLMHSAMAIFFNIGKATAKNISCYLLITGVFNSAINKTSWYNISELPAKKSTGFFITGARGFGLVNIVLSISASNAEITIRTAKGFQIGGFTWIPLTWLTPGILHYFIPWMNWHPAT